MAMLSAKRIRRAGAALALALPLGLFLSLALAMAAQDGAALLQERCTACHGTELACAKLGKLDRGGWDWVVNEMHRGGARLDVDEKRILVDWLAALEPGSPPVCPAPEQAAPPEAHDGPTLVMSRCTRCHDTVRICRNLRGKGKDAWDVTVTRMMMRGAQVDSAEKALIVDYLFGLPAGAAPVCPK
ncbi:hypothetical protein [Desulfocurvus vexinensis]|uniref:hypothetical protein n=1 Tax=Desulfocurvus vexinensis TaxID=399548 RepID=UPI0004AE2985|nr:hypothetical protein [Desulfocurvus vexinensis]